MACLASHEIGQRALSERALLADVIKHKKLFYNSAHAKYDDCLNSAMRLAPHKDLLSALQQDFTQMLGSGMFYGKQTTFSNIIKTIQLLERSINFPSK